MKFTNYLKSIDDVSIYPIITLVLFLFIFILATILIFSKRKETIHYIKNLPLQNNMDTANTNSTNSTETINNH